MKNIFQYSLIIFAIVSIVACSNNEADENPQRDIVSFQATVLENKGSYLVVKPIENSKESSSADQIHVSISDARLLDENKNEITIENFLQEMMISITYNGMIAESYPAQIHKVYEIKILQ